MADDTPTLDLDNPEHVYVLDNIAFIDTWPEERVKRVFALTDTQAIARQMGTEPELIEQAREHPAYAELQAIFTRWQSILGPIKAHYAAEYKSLWARFGVENRPRMNGFVRGLEDQGMRLSKS